MKKAKTNRKSLIESEMKRKKRRKNHNEIASEFRERRSREDEEMHEIRDGLSDWMNKTKIISWRRP